MRKILTIPKPNLTLILKNNTANTLPVQLLLPGNPNDIANQAQTYHVNVAGQTFSDQVAIQWRTKGSLGAYTTSVVTLLQRNIDGLIDALNLLNIGSFWKSSATTVDGASVENEFGFLIMGNALFIADIITVPYFATLDLDFSSFVKASLDWGDGSAPDGVFGSGMYTHTYTVAGTYNIVLFVDNPSLLTRIDAGPDRITSVSNLSEYANLSTLKLILNRLTTFDISGNPALLEVSVASNFISTAAINASLIALDGFGLSGGMYDSTTQTPAAPPTGAGAAAKTSLQGKGWIVVTD